MYENTLKNYMFVGGKGGYSVGQHGIMKDLSIPIGLVLIEDEHRQYKNNSQLMKQGFADITTISDELFDSLMDSVEKTAKNNKTRKNHFYNNKTKRK
jgi:hypothetical protein